MVSIASIAAMVFTLAVCFVVPIGGFILLARRFKGVGRAFGCGMLAFFVSQVITRIPLMVLVVPNLPEPAKGILASLPVASFTAGLFEETGRLVVMILLMKRFHRLADGLAFGLGHGGLEAMLLVGLTYVNNIVLAVLMNMGVWDSIAKSLPSETASSISNAMTQTPAVTFLDAGVERIGAIALHTALSLVILAGVVHGRKALAWLVAFCLHGLANISVVSAVQARVLPNEIIEVMFIVVVGALLAFAIKLLGPTFPTVRAPALAQMPPPGPPQA